MDRDGAGAFPCHSGAGWPSLLLLRRANARSLRSHWDRCACQGAIRRWQLSWDLWRNPSCQNWVSYLSATWEWTLEGCPTPTGVFHCRPVKRRLCLIHCTSSWLSSTGRTVIRLREFFHNRRVMFHIVSYCFVTSWGMKDMNFKCFNEESSAMFDSNDSMRFCVLFWFLCRTCEGLWLLVKPWISSLVEKPAWLAANSANRWSTRTEHNIEIHWIILPLLPKLSVCVLAAVSHFQRWRAIPKIFRHYYQPPPAFL